MYKLILSVIITCIYAIGLSAQSKTSISYSMGYTNSKHIANNLSIETRGFLIGAIYKIDADTDPIKSKTSIIGLDLGLRASSAFAYGFGVELAKEANKKNTYAKWGWHGFLQLELSPNRLLSPLLRVDLSTHTGIGASIGLSVKL